MKVHCFSALFLSFFLSQNGSFAQEEKKVPTSLSQIQMSFSPLIKKVAPAVVSINAQHEQSQSKLGAFNNDFLNFFFGRDAQSKGNKPQAKLKSVGSGVIISDLGYVVTCSHVVRDANKITVQLTDNRQFDAEVTLVDQANDLVILKLRDVHKSSVPIPFVSLQQNGVLDVGDLVLAIGNPFSVGQSVTSGIISALARNVNGRVLIQTDASINPGNSGGALVDMDGDLVAIPNAIVSKSGGSLGIGFAIPSSVVKPLLKAALSGKDIEYPWDGISIETLMPDRAESFSLGENTQGAFVTSVYDKSPAAEAGIKAKDIIINMNGEKIRSAEDYILKINELSVGDDVQLKIYTPKGERDVSFKVISPPMLPMPNKVTLKGKHPLNGVTVANLSPGLIKLEGLNTQKEGVVVLDSGNTSKMGGLLSRGQAFSVIQKGDIVSEYNGSPIQSVEDLEGQLMTNFESMILLRGGNVLKIQTHSKNNFN